MLLNVDKPNCRNIENVTGTIFGVQHFSIHDGPGIRSTVFLKGCQLRCLWCHNPESVIRRPILSFTSDKCLGCGNCFKVCRKNVHKIIDGKHLIDRDECIGCGSCQKECHGKALELVGREAAVKEVIEDVLRDKMYYETSNGGITLSGGEPLLQIDFVKAILEMAKRSGLHCAVETSGFCNYNLIESILPMVDLFLFDYKESNPEKHKEFTGVDNKLILENLRRLHDTGARILLRCPIIPGLNAREDHFSSIAGLTNELGNLEGAEILPYHSLGVSKADRMGLRVKPEFEQPDAKTVDQWKGLVRQYGGRIINS